MKLIIQRVKKSKLIFENGKESSINDGLLVYVGIHIEDDLKDIELCIKKMLNLRIFENEEGKIHYSIKDLNYELMIISNFSLYGSMKKGNRPSFTISASPEKANKLYLEFLKKLDLEKIKYVSGEFQTYMKIESINDGPMNLIFDTKEGEKNV